MNLSHVAYALIFAQCCFLHAHSGAEGFQWTQEKMELAEIQTQAAGPGVIQHYVRAPGKMSFHPDYVAYVIPKVEGVVTRIHKNLGETVEQDDVLVVIESKEIAECKANYLAALKKNALYQTLLTREKGLKGISAGQDYLHAQLAAEEALINKELAVQSLYALGLSEREIGEIPQEKGANLRYFAIKAPIKGRVVQKDLTMGELVTHSTRAFTIANAEKMWIEINVNQQDAQYLKEGLPIEVVAQDKSVTATLLHLNPAICEETRTATAIALLDNTSETWRQGEFVTAKIQTYFTEAPIVIPRDAIQTIHGEDYVFVADADCFKLCAVKTGKIDEINVEILAGLEPGQPYASCNTFCLKAEYEKDEAEHSH